MYHPRPALIVVLLLSLVVAAPLAGPQNQFRAGTDTVPVHVTVRDNDGTFVTDLTEADFELRDNGRVRPITQFTTDIQPLSVVLLIDGSGSMMPEFNRALEGARSFVVRMLPADRAVIGSFAESIRFGPRFTSDRDLLLEYLRNEFNLRLGLETHLWESLFESAQVLGEERGRRVIIALSDGYNFVTKPRTTDENPLGRNPITGQPQRLPGSRPNPGATGTSISAGNMPNGDPSRNGVPMGSARSAAVAGDVIVYAVSMWVRNETTSRRPSRDLERLAIDTGGSFVQLKENDDVNPTFTGILRELRQQYLLGFTPAVFDDKEHDLEVRVKRSGVSVRARRSYLASRER